MSRCMNIPAFLQRYMVVSIPVVLSLGFLAGWGFNLPPLQFLVAPFTFLMVYPSMVGLQYKQVFSGGDLKLQLATQAFNFLLIPALALGIGILLFPNDPMLRLGLFMTGLLPTSGMTLSWTNMAKGNLPSAVKMTVIGLIAGSLLAPFYLNAVFGKSVAIPLGKTLAQIGLVVFLPMLLGFMTQRFLVMKFGQQDFSEKIKHRIAPWGTIGVLGVQFVAMAMKADDLAARPSLILVLGIPMLLLYTLNFTLSSLVARRFVSRKDGIAFIYGTALRNLPIALAIAMTVLGNQAGDVALLISMGFIFQAQMAAWHVKSIGKILPD